MLRANYHTHTFRCGHAEGTDEEYILAAISNGFDTIGFSDHIMLPGFSQPSVRGEYSVMKDYLSSLTALKEKYADRITVHIGFEAEGLEEYFPYYKTLLEGKIIDFLILGNHFTLAANKRVNYFGRTDKDELLQYRDTALAALRTGLFSAFAHPDYFMTGYASFDRQAEKVSKEIIMCAKECDVPLEINVAGIRNGKRKIGKEYRYIYPYEKFWDIVGKTKAKAYIGLDAHSPLNFCDDAVDIAIRLAQEKHIKIEDTLVFKKRFNL